jgi:hypothetical protein
MEADCKVLEPSPSRSTPAAWRRGQDVNRFVVRIKKQNGREWTRTIDLTDVNRAL